MGQLNHVSEVEPGPTKPQTREETPAQSLLRRPDSGSPTVFVVAEDPSRKRKRSPEPPISKAETDPPSQPQVDKQASERSSQASQSSKKLRMDCVLITTLPPVRKTAPPETFEDENHGTHVRTGSRGREKQRGKRRDAASTSRASALSDSQSLAERSTRSLSHSVSSLRRPLFDPVSLELL